MEQRLTALLQTLGISANKFAETIDVQPSSISHIISGRNKPSYDFILKTLTKYPQINSDWLILGTGDMFKYGSIDKTDQDSNTTAPDIRTDNTANEGPLNNEVNYRADSSETLDQHTSRIEGNQAAMHASGAFSFDMSPLDDKHNPLIDFPTKTVVIPTQIIIIYSDRSAVIHEVR